MMDLNEIGLGEELSTTDVRMTTEEIAMFVYRSLSDFNECIDEDLVEWESVQDGTIKAVNYVISCAANPNSGAVARDLHDHWMLDKITAGWRYGEKKDPELKTHPAMLPFFSLPEHIKVKDLLFRNIVLSLLPIWSGH